LIIEAPGRPRKIAPKNMFKGIIKILSSMQLGIMLLLILAAISVFATTREMERAIEYIYRSWWYLGLIAFTALNLILCTAKRIVPLLRQTLKPIKAVTEDGIRKMPVSRALKIQEQRNPVAVAAGAFKQAGLNISVSEGSDGAAVVFGEKGRFGYFGSFLTHLSLLVIFFGAVYGGLTGYEDQNCWWVGSNFFVPEGDFQVKIADIRMAEEENPAIRPRIYTDVIITRGDTISNRGTVSINYPLRFEGNSIYHSTFVYLPLIKLTDINTGETKTSRFFEDAPVYLDPLRTTYIQLRQFFPHFAMRPDGSPYNVNYRADNPVAAGFLVRNNLPDGVVFLKLDRPNVFETPEGSVEAVLTGFELATVFSINKNLGRPYLFAGALLMLAGLYLSFFIFPCRFWAIFDQRESTLLIGGRGYSQGRGVEQVMERIETEIIRGEDKNKCPV